ncbi:MAG: outer membrane protein assembly factor BamA [Bacteroidota bacterium]
MLNKSIILPLIFFLHFGFALSMLFPSPSIAQISITDDFSSIDYSNPKEYEIGGITVTGTKYLDKKVLIMLSGLSVGDRIQVPGEKISKAIEKLWKQGLFSDIQISATKIQGNNIFLNFHLLERPRLSKFSFSGVKKSQADDLREKIKLIKGKVITDNMIITTTNSVMDYFIDKGYMNVQVELGQEEDSTLHNSMILQINVNKNKKVKINQIITHGNIEFHSRKLKRALKNTKEKHWYRIFSSSKFLKDSYEKDKEKIISKYNDKGYRDAKIIKDTLYKFDDKTINLEITIDEGSKYYFRNITWVGNAKYTSEELDKVLGIAKGDVFNQSVLDAHLYMNPNGSDVSSLYLDDGYLFFSITPVEVLVENDSINMEMRIYEGKQATINKITVKGNTKTNDHVIMREIRTKPGQLFNRSDIIRSQRELAQLGYFDPEKLNVNPSPNPQDGTVDIEYIVEERSSDQIELSGGWGGYGGIVGSFGVIFSNFSTKNFFKKGAWSPLPAGDGQQLTLRAQSNGTWFQSYSASFTEPWLGGKKPNSFSVSLYHSVRTNGEKKDDPDRASFKTTGVSVGLGKRLAWPDDYFTLFQQFSYRNYSLENYGSSFIFSDGVSNTFSLTETFARNSIDQPLYPRRGAQISLTIEATPPFSLFDGIDDYSNLSLQDKYKWNEYHKWKFKLSWFSKLAGNLVLNTRMQFGFLGLYNSDIGVTPFERFSLGGSGLSGFTLYGTEIIALRGYPDGSLSPSTGSTIFNKYTFELRYPVSLNPSATIYGLAFAEAGNAWNKFNEFKPFEVKKSLGFGIRIFLPMFGLLGFDFGYGFDDLPKIPGDEPSGWQTHFIIGYSID